MTPSTIEGWEIETMQEDLLYRYSKTIGQNELTIDINVKKSPKNPWGRIEDPQNSENSIDITYDQVYQKWVSNVHVHGTCGKHSSMQKPGPRIDQNFDTAADLAEFLVNLADEIDRTSWENVKKQAVLTFT
jgi:hypothetical protein